MSLDTIEVSTGFSPSDAPPSVVWALVAAAAELAASPGV